MLGVFLCPLAFTKIYQIRRWLYKEFCTGLVELLTPNSLIFMRLYNKRYNIICNK
jgi:hypothetical protein